MVLNSFPTQSQIAWFFLPFEGINLRIGVLHPKKRNVLFLRIKRFSQHLHKRTIFGSPLNHLLSFFLNICRFFLQPFVKQKIVILWHLEACLIFRSVFNAYYAIMVKFRDSLILI